MSNAVSDVNQWYAVHVRHRNEFKISEYFREIFGFHSIVPSHKIWKWKKGVKNVGIKPILCNYVFLKLNIKDFNWGQVFTNHGVYDFVRKGGRPAAIPNEQIECLEKLGVSDKPVHELGHIKFNKNDRVVVVGGALKGAVGNYIGNGSDSGRFIVCLDLFQRALSTELEAEMVQPF
jgi:transcription antitermination factor NusG